jgi:21S rRNA (GM2251-2'-O)-methyltransferase
MRHSVTRRGFGRASGGIFSEDDLKPINFDEVPSSNKFSQYPPRNSASRSNSNQRREGSNNFDSRRKSFASDQSRGKPFTGGDLSSSQRNNNDRRNEGGRNMPTNRRQNNINNSASSTRRVSAGGGRVEARRTNLPIWEDGSYVRRERSPEFEERQLRNEGMEYLYGITPVLNALLSNKRGTYGELLLQDRSVSKSSLSKSLMSEVESVVKLATKLNIPIEYVSKHDLNMLSDNRPHQGVVLGAAPMVLEQLVSLPNIISTMVNGDGIMTHQRTKKKNVWLALDEVVDPQNLGALLRSACFLGAQGVVVCTKNSAALSPVVSKASAGALEIGNLYETNNMPRFLSLSVDHGWKVIGTCAGGGDSIPLSQLDTSQSTVVVLGNEGHGLRFAVERACTTMVNIPSPLGTLSDPSSIKASVEGGEGEGQSQVVGHGGVSSLNVAVSGGIVLYHLLS